MPDTETINRMRDQKLAAADFIRTTYTKADTTLLLGNAEMGGRARLDGLGFDRLWFADFWRTNAARMPIFGPRLFVADGDETYVGYRQQLVLKNGLLITDVKKTDAAYKSELFFSASDKDQLVIRLSQLQGKAQNALYIDLPYFDIDGKSGNRWKVNASGNDSVFTIKQVDAHFVTGRSIDNVMADPKNMYENGPFAHTTNQLVYSLTSSASLQKTNLAYRFKLTLKPDQRDVLLTFTRKTNWSGELLTAWLADRNTRPNEFNFLLKAHTAVWRSDWEKMAVIDIPDKRHEQLWYRSLFWLLSTCASEKFLPGESQFGFEGWQMIPFTYGAAGWGVHAFTMLGYPEKAKQMLKAHFKPAAAHRNALHWLRFAQEERRTTGYTKPGPYPPDTLSPAALYFAHEIRTMGDGTLLTWENQLHLTGFALELFNRYYTYYQDEEVLYQQLYPAARGLAEFWSNALIWNDSTSQYFTAKTWGASEGGMHNSSLDAVFAAKKCLRLAASYATQLGVDNDLITKWRFIEQHITYPENADKYLPYRSDDVTIPAKSIGYNGIRYMNAANFVNQALVSELNKEKVTRTLDRISQSNQFGKGFAVFQAAQTATTEALFGRGDASLQYLNTVLRALDNSGTSIRECEDRPMPYFMTNSNAYLVSMLFMLIQASGDAINVFPALPSAWKDVAFYNLPVDKKIRVSARMQQGKLNWVAYTTNGGTVLKK